MSFEDSSLCSDCQREDWKDLAERPLGAESTHERAYYKGGSAPGRLVRTMEKSHNQLKNSKCRCCRILSTIEDKENPKAYYIYPPDIRHLEVMTLESQMLFLHQECRQGSLALLQIGNWEVFNNVTGSGRGYLRGYQYIALFGPGKDSAPFRIPPFIEDFTWIQNAISRCSQKYCRCFSANLLLFVPGLLVIDCLADSPTLSLVSAPKPCQYAALSYVWGCAHTNSTEVPAVIKDAIEVTVKLGLRFLWVDKYCIAQDDPENHQLIRSMGEVYSGAYITIIAAAGETSTDGLPGISTVPRKAQMETEVGGCTFLELPYASNSVQTSTWVQRGWTYQEGLLSRRCLAFTERGVIYHCMDSRIEESLQQLTQPGQAETMDYWDVLPSIFANDNLEYSELKYLIVEYTRRHLSYHQDSLNAFLGIFAEFERQGEKWGSASYNVSLPAHIWGLPLQRGVPILDWYHPEPPKQRRLDFPSWSWSGWEGGIEFGNKYSHSFYDCIDSKYTPISVEIPDKLTDFCDQKTKRLYVTGAITTLKFATREQTQSIIDGTKQLLDTSEVPNLNVRTSHHHCVFDVSPGIFAIIRSTFSSEPKIEDQSLGLLVTAESRSGEDSVSVRSIIVLRKGDQSFTRIGHISVEAIWNRRFVNIDGISIDKKTLPLDVRDGFSFGQQYARQRVCLE